MTDLVAIAGYGAVGSVAAAVLASRREVQIRLGGRDLERCGAAARLIPRATAMTLDVEDPRTVTAFVDGARAVIYAGPSLIDGSVEPRLVIARLAHAAGAHYVDAGWPDPMLSRIQESSFSSSRLACVVGASWSPGLSDLMMVFGQKLAEQQWGGLESLALHTFYQGGLGRAAVLEILESVKDRSRARRWVDGAWRQAGPETFQFPEPIGARIVMPDFPAHLARLVTGPRLSAFLGVSEAMLKALDRRNDLEGLLEASYEDARSADAAEVICVDAEGRDGRRIRISLVTRSGARMAGIVPGLLTQRLLSGAPVKGGPRLLAQAVEPEAFLAQLDEAGIAWSLESTSPEETSFRASFWAPDTPPPRAPRLTGSTSCDAIVVGGGIVGVSTALHLRAAGLDVALLEAEHIGHGSSARNAGILTLPFTYGGLASRWLKDLGKARLQVRFSQRSIDTACAFIEKSEVQCGLARRPLYLLAHDRRSADELRSGGSFLRAMGLQVDYSTEEFPTSFRPSACLAIHDQAVVNPFELMRGLRRVALDAGVRLHEGSTVDAIEGGSPVLVKTRDGAMSARWCVVALNALAQRLTSFGGHIQRCIAYGLATAPLDEAVARSIGPATDVVINDYRNVSGRPSFFERLRPDRRLLFGASVLWPTESERVRRDDEMKRFIQEEMRRRYPGLERATIDASWGGLVCMTSSGLPIFAFDPERENVLLAVVGNGRGMGLGVTAGALVRRVLIGAESEDREAEAFLELCRIV